MTRAERLISIGGGKGGVGKSVLAGNLATALAQSGKRTVLVDADLGAPNLHTMFGIDKAGPTLQSFIDHEVESLDEARVETSVRGLTLVRGTSAIIGAANIGFQQKQRLLRHLCALQADVVVVDVGAGTGFNQLDLFDVADQKVVVMTPQLTSIHNAYAFVKGAVFRIADRILKAHGFEKVLDERGHEGETASLKHLLRDVIGCSPKVEAELRETLEQFRLKLFGNQVFDVREAGIFRAVGKMMGDFLSVPAPLIGYARASRAVHESVNRRQPLLAALHNDETGRAFREVAAVLLAEPIRRGTWPALLPDALQETAAA
ncbi:MAG: P-loop NTPase [Myxococcaceae bacterium]|nr:P-loop NTPase [Myxococcaceae bacterium]